jgi:hypothetical protein
VREPPLREPVPNAAALAAAEGEEDQWP